MRPFVIVVAATTVLFLPLCALLHGCGCAAPWAGAGADCNVHHDAGPHCPWCEQWWLGGAALVLILGAQLVAYRAVKRRARSAVALLAAGLALVPAGALVGALLWLPTDYPHFLVPDARARLGLPAGPIHCIRR